MVGLAQAGAPSTKGGGGFVIVVVVVVGGGFVNVVVVVGGGRPGFVSGTLGSGFPDDRFYFWRL